MIRELMELPMPFDHQVEQLTLSALIVGHRRCSRWLKRLNVDDFYLGDAEVHGWLFVQVWWAHRKRVDPVREIMESDRSKFPRLGAALYKMLQPGRCGIVRQLPQYVSVLKQLRAHRDHIDAAERAYQRAWNDYEIDCHWKTT